VPAGDVELKHLLWTLQQQWGASTGAWLEAPFFELDVVDMTEQVRRLCTLLCAAVFICIQGRFLMVRHRLDIVKFGDMTVQAGAACYTCCMLLPTACNRVLRMVLLSR
jgi:hypothetical protein